MSLYYSSEIRKLFSQISLKKQEIEQLRSKELLTAEDENAIIDNAIEIARLEVKISEQQGKEANDSFNYGLPPGLIGFQVVEKRFVPRTDSLDESFGAGEDAKASGVLREMVLNSVHSHRYIKGVNIAFFCIALV